MIKYLRILAMVFGMLHSEAVELNLPEKFDVKTRAMPHMTGESIDWNFLYSSKMFIYNGEALPNVVVFHFDKKHFTFSGNYIDKRPNSNTTYLSGNGILNDDGSLSGEMIDITKAHDNHWIWKRVFKLKGYIHNKEFLRISSKKVDEVTKNKCGPSTGRTCELSDISYKSGYFISNGWIVNKNSVSSQTWDYIFLLQLPINQSQSAQTLTETPPVQQEQPPKALIDTQTPISAGNNIPASTPPVQSKPTNPCQDPAFKNDPDWKTYCANKAANAKADAEYEKAQAKEEAEYQRKLAEYEKQKAQWDKEEEQRRIAQAKENEANTKRWREANKRQDRIDNQKIADDMQKRKAFQKQQQKNMRLINKFAESGDEWSAAYHRIKKLDQSGDIEKSKKIYSAHKKMYYDSKQLKHQADYAYEMGKEKALAESEKYVESVRDTALTINKVAAKFDPTGMGDKIVETMENTYETIDAYSKGGIEGVVDHYVEKKASELSGGLSDVAKESIETLKDLKAGKRIKLKSHEYYYDQKGNRLTTYKKGEKVYNEKHEEVTYSFNKRLFYNALYKANEEHNLIQQGATKTKAFIKAAKSGDINGMVNTGMELKDTKEGIESGADTVVKKVTGEEK